MYNKDNEFNSEEKKVEEIKNESFIKNEDEIKHETKDDSSLDLDVELEISEHDEKIEEKLEERAAEDSIDYSSVSGTKEYIYSPNSAYSENAYSSENNDKYTSAYNETTAPNYNSSNNYNNEAKPENYNKKKSKRRFLATVSLVLVVSILSGVAGSFATMYLYKNGVLDKTPTKSDNTQTVKINLNDGTYYAAAVNEKTKNTVVGITTTVTMIYESFWGSEEREGQSIGSGIIVDPDGLILTNSHVIGDGNAKKIVVSLTDGTTEEANVLWYDQTLDLAVIKINRTGLTAAELGDSDELVVGEPVVAIGNPMSLSLNGTLTNGVISGLNRSITINNVTIKPLIQTNASINPGNSGGPLFNAEGKVIGINTAKMSSAEGLGFSIPINVVIPILEQITKGETVNNLYVGIAGIGVVEYQERMNIKLSAEYGVVIIEIAKGSPVDKAGLMFGDIITAIDDVEVKEMSDLKRALYNYEEGDKATIKYIRNGSENTVEITLEQKPENY